MKAEPRSPQTIAEFKVTNGKLMEEVIKLRQELGTMSVVNESFLTDEKERNNEVIQLTQGNDSKQLIINRFLKIAGTNSTIDALLTLTHSHGLGEMFNYFTATASLLVKASSSSLTQTKGK